MSKRGKRYSSEFKAKVAMEAIKEECTLAELSAKYGVSSIQIGKWKKQALEKFAGIFEQDGKASAEKKEMEKKIQDLYKQVGKLTMENEWMSDKLHLFR